MGEYTFQFISSSIAMTIPLLFVVFMINDSDSRRIILYFCWGVFAGVLAFNLNNYFGYSMDNPQRITLTIAPIVEEICKVLPVLLFIRKKEHSGARTLTTLIVFCAMTSGVGFSIQESMYYFAISSREVGDLIALTIRAATTALMHGMTTAAFGIGVLILHKHILIPMLFGLLALSVSLHALFNLLLQTPLALLAVGMPVMMFFSGLILVRHIESKGNSSTENYK